MPDLERRPGGRVTAQAMRRANAQHRAIVRALLAGDLARAERALVRNLGTFRPEGRP
jgi:DNA-binding GntR family transcriptional regulator